MMNKDIKEKVINALAEHLGVETDDIGDEDSLTLDLHMRPSDLSDFVGSLDVLDLETEKVDLTEIDTVTELIDALGGESS